MRKRSNAIDSDSLQEYSHLATLSENNTSLFYSEDRLSFSSLDTYGCKRKKVKIQELPCMDDFEYSFEAQEEQDQEQQMHSENRLVRKNVMNIMGFGCSQTGKKTLIDQLYNTSDCLSTSSLLNSDHNYLLDIIVKDEALAGGEKNVYKFWIHNTSKCQFYREIVSIYYRHCDLMLLFFRITSESSFDDLVTNYERLEEKRPFILVGMDFDTDSLPIEVSPAMVSPFLERHPAQAVSYLRTNENNRYANCQLEELITRLTRNKHSI